MLLASVFIESSLSLHLDCVPKLSEAEGRTLAVEMETVTNEREAALSNLEAARGR